MKNILETIADKTKLRIEEDERQTPLEQVRDMIAERQMKELYAPLPDFLAALKATGMSYICEVKKASPSKGLIAPDFPYMDIAAEYEAAGASAISCLTEPYWFLGSDLYVREISERVNIPVLRKDFTVNEYMI